MESNTRECFSIQSTSQQAWDRAGNRYGLIFSAIECMAKREINPFELHAKWWMADQTNPVRCWSSRLNWHDTDSWELRKWTECWLMLLSTRPPADVAFSHEPKIIIMKSSLNFNLNLNLSYLGDLHFMGLRTGTSFDRWIVKSKIQIAFVFNLSQIVKSCSVVTCLHPIQYRWCINNQSWQHDYGYVQCNCQERDAVIDNRKTKFERIISLYESSIGISGDFLDPLNITEFENFSDATEIFNVIWFDSVS
jgi:hypothetical protein